MNDETNALALQAAVHDGAVLLFGPGPVNLVMTPETAEQSAAILMQAAMAARLGKSGVVRPGGPVGDEIVIRAKQAAQGKARRRG